MKKVRFVGFDVHAQTIAAAVAEPDGEVRNLGMIANRVESVRKLLKKLGTPGQLKVCYEAGPLPVCATRTSVARLFRSSIFRSPWQPNRLLTIWKHLLSHNPNYHL
jgi:hypothetical protein